MVIDFLMGDLKQKLLFCWVRLLFYFYFTCFSTFSIIYHMTYPSNAWRFHSAKIYINIFPWGEGGF